MVTVEAIDHVLHRAGKFGTGWVLVAATVGAANAAVEAQSGGHFAARIITNETRPQKPAATASFTAKFHPAAVGLCYVRTAANSGVFLKIRTFFAIFS